MTFSRKKKFALAFSLALVSSVLTSCGAGLNAPTAMIKQVTDGAEVDLGFVKIRHLLIVAQADGSGTLVGTIVNTGVVTDDIVALGINGQNTTFSGTTSLPQNEPVIFEGARANARVTIPVLGAAVGSYVPVEFRFGKSGSVKVNVLVRDRTAEFAEVGGAIATPAPSASPTK